MAVNGKALVPILLVLSGFAGGYVLSGEASRHFALQRAPQSSGAGGGAAGGGAGAANGGGSGAGGSGGASAANGGGSGGGGSGGGGAANGGGSGGGGSGGGGAANGGGFGGGGSGGAEAANGGAAGGAGAANGGGSGGGAAGGAEAANGGSGGASGGGGAGAERTPSGEEAARADERPCRTVDVFGVEAAALLAGNTVVDARHASGHVLTYFAPRGLQGWIGPTSIVVRPWNPKAAVLCEPRDPETGVKACETIRVRRCTGASTTAAMVGEVLLPSGRWARILAGNMQNFPNYIPLLDEARRPSQNPGRRAPGAARPAAASGFDTTQTYKMPQSETEPDGRVVYYAPDGRRLDFVLPNAEQVGAGVEVALGWWTFAKGILCQGRGPNGRDGSCSRPKPRRDGHVLLVSTGRAQAAELLALPDVAPIRAVDGDG